MNKEEFLKQLQNKTGLDEEKCLKISDVMDDIFLIGKKNKEKMISGFIEKVGVSESEADKIYNTAMDIIKNNLKDKLKHPFKSQD